MHRLYLLANSIQLIVDVAEKASQLVFSRAIADANAEWMDDSDQKGEKKKKKQGQCSRKSEVRKQRVQVPGFLPADIDARNLFLNQLNQRLHGKNGGGRVALCQAPREEMTVAV